MTPEHEDGTRTAYDQVADVYADHFPGVGPEHPLELAMIDHFAASVPEPRRVLDAGCGAGRMLPYLAQRGCQVHGVDLSPQMVRRARQDHPEFPCVVGTLAALPWPDAIYDGVFAWYSTIHTPDAELPAVIAELRRVLRPGGVLLVAFQTGRGVREVGQGFRSRGYDMHLQRWHRTAGEALDTMRAAAIDPLATLDLDPDDERYHAMAVLVGRRPPS